MYMCNRHCGVLLVAPSPPNACTPSRHEVAEKCTVLSLLEEIRGNGAARCSDDHLNVGLG
jgi:hypothetical protein